MRTKVWSLPIRLSHWLLAISFALAYILSDFDNYRNLHFAFGALVGSVLIFRILFGIIGPRYAHFKDFPIGFSNQISFVKNFFNNSNLFIGHNPAASIIMLSIFVVGILCSLSGLMLVSQANNIFTNFNLGGDFLEETHEVLANVFLALVILHLLGLLADVVFHNKLQTIKSIFTGYKNIEGADSKMNSFQIAYSIVWLIIPFIVFYYAYGLKSNESNENIEGNKIENNRNRDGDDD